MLATTYLLYMWGAQCSCLIVNVVWDGWEWEWGQCTLVIVALREREREMCCHCQVSVGGALHCHHCHIDVVVVIHHCYYVDVILISSYELTSSHVFVLTLSLCPHVNVIAITVAVILMSLHWCVAVAVVLIVMVSSQRVVRVSVSVTCQCCCCRCCHFCIVATLRGGLWWQWWWWKSCCHLVVTIVAMSLWDESESGHQEKGKGWMWGWHINIDVECVLLSKLLYQPLCPIIRKTRKKKTLVDLSLYKVWWWWWWMMLSKSMARIMVVGVIMINIDNCWVAIMACFGNQVCLESCLQQLHVGLVEVQDQLQLQPQPIKTGHCLVVPKKGKRPDQIGL